MRDVLVSVLAVMLVCSSLAYSQDLSAKDITSLPNDFALSYSDELIGIVPAENSYIDITRNKGASDGSCTLVSGILSVFRHGGPKTKDPTLTKRLTKEQCLELYKDAVRMGFFELNNRYTDEKVSGGYGVTMSITADGKTQTVKAINVQVAEITALITKLQKLMK